jgi:hypothetical protein
VTWRERSGNLARTRRGPPPFSGERKAKLAQITGKFTGKFLDFIHFSEIQPPNTLAYSVACSQIPSRIKAGNFSSRTGKLFLLNRESEVQKR